MHWKRTKHTVYTEYGLAGLLTIGYKINFSSKAP